MKVFLRTLILIAGLTACQPKAAQEDPKEKWYETGVISLEKGEKSIPLANKLSCRSRSAGGTLHHYYVVSVNPQEAFFQSATERRYTQAIFAVDSVKVGEGFTYQKLLKTYEGSFLVFAEENGLRTYRFMAKAPTGEEIEVLKISDSLESYTNLTDGGLPGIAPGQSLECQPFSENI